jgi:adenosylcobinamide-GDP ribazoletransferase
MTRERKLDIMKDSRIGTFGGAALILSLAARIAALAAILSTLGAEAAAAALIACAAVARMCGLAPLVLLPPARSEGAAWAAERPAPGALAAGSLLSVAIAVIVPGFAGYDAAVSLLACALALAAALAMTWIAQRQIQGQTGDTAGAAEQLAEIAFLSVLASAYAA